MHFDLDPKPVKVVLLGVIQFLMVILSPILTIMQSQGRLPDQIEFLTILFVALMWFLSYLSLWIHTGEQPPIKDEG